MKEKIMNMKRILIIEDERMNAERLKRLINEYDDTLQVDGPLTSVGEVMHVLKQQPCYDLIFSDICLGEHLVFEALTEIPIVAPIVFTTAYDEYALKAFQHNGIDYLLKPIDIESVRKSFEKIKQSFHLEEHSRALSAVFREMRCYRERVLVTKGDELIPLKMNDIAYVKKDDRVVMAYTFKGESFRLSITLNDLEEQLDPDRFFRINRQYLANVNSIQKISFYFHSKLKVRLIGCDDDQIFISKEKSSLFKQWLDR